MSAPAPFFHLDALRSVLEGTAATAGADSAAAPRSVLPLGFVTTGALLWPQEHAHRVLHEWAQWTRSVPEDVTSTGRLVRFPRLSGVPAALRGRAFVAVEVAIPGEPWVAEGRLVALRRLGPEIDTVVLANAGAPPALHRGLEVPAAAIGRQAPLPALTPAVIDAFVAAAGPASGSPLASAELRQAGRAYEVSAVGRARGDEDASRLGVRLDIVVGDVAAVRSYAITYGE